ncbi:MAG: hypothetical protein AAFR61_21720 [Bacteroidota bacterium]
MNFAAHQRMNLALLGLLIAACVYFSTYDIQAEKIWWTTWYIYLPRGLIFFLGSIIWKKPSPTGLGMVLGFLLLIDLFLIGYGAWLSLQGEMLWGPLTLAFAGLTGLLSWSTWKARGMLMAS